MAVHARIGPPCKVVQCMKTPCTYEESAFALKHAACSYRVDNILGSKHRSVVAGNQPVSSRSAS